MHFVYSLAPIVRLHILSLIRSISCTIFFKNIGRKKVIITHAAICTPNDEYHTSISNPMPTPISISAQRGIRTGRLSRKRIYIIGNPQLPICRWLNSNTCSRNTSTSVFISLNHSILSRLSGRLLILRHGYKSPAHI